MCVRHLQIPVEYRRNLVAKLSLTKVTLQLTTYYYVSTIILLSFSYTIGLYKCFALKLLSYTETYSKRF